MRVHILIVIALLMSATGSTQVHGFQSFPTTGAIESIEIVKSEEGQEERVEYTVFDALNRIELRQRKNDGRVLKTEETIYTDSTAITYKCTCENTLQLQQAFKPIGYRPAELGPGKRSAGSNQSLVDISKLDKHGNPIETTYYFDDGFIQSTAKMTYDAKNRLLTKDIWDYKGDPMYYERFRYDERGNLLERISKFEVDAVESRKYYTYDEQNKMTEVKAFMGDRPSSHTSFHTVRTDSTFNEYTVYHHKGDTVLISQTTLDSLGREVVFKSLQADGTIAETKTVEYYPSGRISKQTFQPKDRMYRREEFFADTDQNPCYQIIQYIPTLLPKQHEKIAVSQPYVYLRKIRYRSLD